MLRVSGDAEDAGAWRAAGRGRGGSSAAAPCRSGDGLASVSSRVVRGRDGDRVGNGRGPPASSFGHVVGRAAGLTRGGVVLTVSGDEGVVERQLAGGELSCPSCGGVLGCWGRARQRRVRVLEGPAVGLVPRRARCRGCGATHVLLPAW